MGFREMDERRRIEFGLSAVLSSIRFRRGDDVPVDLPAEFLASPAGQHLKPRGQERLSFGQGSQQQHFKGAEGFKFSPACCVDVEATLRQAPFADGNASEICGPKQSNTQKLGTEINFQV
jgi:hypothetical protein